MIKPRFEFRSFAEDFAPVEEKMKGLSKLERFRESSETYIIAALNDKNNVKIRYDTLDIKKLVKEQRGLQQWAPQAKEAFPLKMEIVRDQVLAALNVPVPRLKRAEYSIAQFIAEIVEPHPQLEPATVDKRRFGYTISGCISEFAKLEINRTRIQTIALESVDPEAVMRAKRTLGLQGLENINYLTAIKRVLAVEKAASE